MAEVVNAQYGRRDWLKGESQFTLFNQCYLRVEQRKGKVCRDFRIHVATLSPHFRWVKDTAWHWLTAALLLFAVALCFVAYVLHAPSLGLLVAALPALLLFAAFALFALLLFRGQSIRQVEVYTRHAAYPLFVIEWCREQEQEYQQFIETLQRHIEVASADEDVDDQVLRAGEVKMLRRLVGHGVLPDTHYQSAKRVIFDQIEAV